MKKLLSVSIIGLMIFSGSTVFAADNTDLLEELEKLEQSEQYQTAKQLNAKLEFESFSTCEDINTVLTDFLEENKDSFNQPYGRGFGGGDMVIMEAMEESAVMDTADGGSIAAPMAKTTTASVTSSSNDVSTTNIQVGGVDEPDILKTDGDYLYYYSQKEKKVFIIQSPLDRSSSSINLDDAEIISTISVPERFNNIQLFLKGTKLVILGQRRRDGQWRTGILERNQRVDIIVYDVSDVDDPTLDRFTDLDGYYKDARLIDNELYVVTQLGVNRWNAWQVMDNGGQIEVNDLIPEAIDVAYKKDGIKNLEINGKEYPYGINIAKSDCNDILYVLPTSETLKETNIMPSFTVVRKITIDEPKSDVDTTTAFGSTQTIHMTKDSLYLADGIWFSGNSTCPPNARCSMPWFGGGEQHTLLHKFDVQSSGLDYRASTLVPGNPLSQYSMSEDNRGNFRLITQTWNPSLNTHLFILDKDLVLEGMVRNIQENEEFKSSRFIGNKLYMVTFERTDPLFVIDLADVNNPEIIGELKIPGYSTYLHPYAAAADGKQYLIGLGYDTAENQRGGVTTAGVKVDLYEVDYTTKSSGDTDCVNYSFGSCPEYCEESCVPSSCSDDGNGNTICTADCGGAGSCYAKNNASNDFIKVTQKYTETYGEQGSWSEALENPRMVVWDENRNLLVIPMLLQNQEKGQNCSIQYDNNGNEISRRCYDSYTQDTTFAGLKAITIDKDTGISEYTSYNYADELIQSRNDQYSDGGDYWEEEMPMEEMDRELHSREFRQFMFRVGYLGDVLYSINNAFGHFAIMGSGDETYLPLND